MAAEPTFSDFLATAENTDSVSFRDKIDLALGVKVADEDSLDLDDIEDVLALVGSPKQKRNTSDNKNLIVNPPSNLERDAEEKIKKELQDNEASLKLIQAAIQAQQFTYSELLKSGAEQESLAYVKKTKSIMDSLRTSLSKKPEQVNQPLINSPTPLLSPKSSFASLQEACKQAEINHTNARNAYSSFKEKLTNQLDAIQESYGQLNSYEERKRELEHDLLKLQRKDKEPGNEPTLLFSFEQLPPPIPKAIAPTDATVFTFHKHLPS